MTSLCQVDAVLIKFQLGATVPDTEKMHAAPGKYFS